MRDYDLNRVVFYSKEDMAGGYNLSKGEHFLNSDLNSGHEDINDILELYNIKKYIDNGLFLRNWTELQIEVYKQKALEYGKLVGQYMAKLNDTNIVERHSFLFYEYENSFWEIVENQKIYKGISSENFKTILKNSPNEIRIILRHKNLVGAFSDEIRHFLLDYPFSAELLLSIFETKEDYSRSEKMYLPRSLSVQDKEQIVSIYIDGERCNLNYLKLIRISRNQENFRISDKTKLKAKRREKAETEKIFEENKNVSFTKHGVSISFVGNQKEIKSGELEGMVMNYSYSLDYVKQCENYHTLFLNFIILFEYLDDQSRIELLSKKNQLGVMERVIGIRSQHEYERGIMFDLNEIASQAQIVGYRSILDRLEKTLEGIIHNIFTKVFHEKYSFPDNTRIAMPTPSVSSFEKVRIIAPEFESVLKQFKLFVEEGEIDFELLQMSSTPSSIKDIPSLNKNKYLYLNEDNETIVACTNLFFSDQAGLAYVDPFKKKRYKNLFDLLANEDVDFNSFEEYQTHKLNYLIQNNFLYVDANGSVQITNIPRLCILKDLYENEFGSYYRYAKPYQIEVLKMKNENIVYLESSLFSKMEQSYFNFYLNKSEFTNGIDLRNSYLHGTQSNPEKLENHEYAYNVYLKLLVLVLLKIEDDLLIRENLISRQETS